MSESAASVIDWYEKNPLTTGDRRLSRSASAWARSFACEDVKPLIVCRGPIRKEAIEVFREMGIEHLGILLSEKDSIVYTHALAPELRRLRPGQVHRVRDYTGATKAERLERMAEIVGICRAHGYTHVFAGYGFMSEDGEFVRTLEEAGLVFIGPRSSVHFSAGRKDEAKRTALRVGVSVTPGIADVTARALLRKHGSLQELRQVAQAGGLAVDPSLLADGTPLTAAADAVLDASYAARVDLVTVDEVATEVAIAASALLAENPGSRARLKAIGGGGGKGQRLLRAIPADLGGEAAKAAAAEVTRAAPGLAREILAEVKAAGAGDDKNILIELNIEETRHNEIQLLGNGTWCIALGGRDCSVQMHEQKLLEVSHTQEGLAQGAARARAEGREEAARALETDLEVLRAMEGDAERFGAAVGLNSASTFECIVSRGRYYFMEVNTRIQVEHRVSELCYALEFTNPEDPADRFRTHAIVEAMVLLARHGKRLPRPARVLREGAAVEARLNATDRSLAPHAGGVIHSWTDPVPHEIRDDQGISWKNPDTGLFMHYRLAGAYDSNIALLVTTGADRGESYRRLCEILRRMKLRGTDLQTNNAFHYGLAHWFLARDVWAKPTTAFVLPYLAQVGLVAEAMGAIDLAHAWGLAGKRAEKRAGARASDAEGGKRAATETRKAFALKETLLVRAIEALREDPHVLSAWLSRNRARIQVREGRACFLVNPIDILADTYWLLNLDPHEGAPAAHVIWDHDRDLLETAQAFYRKLLPRLAAGGVTRPWAEMEALLAAPDAPAGSGIDAALWARIRAAHEGHQLGLEMLLLPMVAGVGVGFFDLDVGPDLAVRVPDRLRDPALQVRMRKVLAPPPATKANEVVAVSGGMFYAKESPDLPPLVSQGSRFRAGDPLYVIEVMKMFNKVPAPFAGTIDEVLVTGGDGVIVQKGQPLFRVTPDERIVEEDPRQREARIRAATERAFAAIAP